MTTPLREVFARFSTRFDDRALRKGEARTDALTSSLKRAGAAFLTAFGIHALRGAIDGFREAGDELDKTSKVIGISIEALQAWRHASNLAGVGAEAFNSSVIRLQRMMLDSTRGVKTATDSFARLGVSATDAEGNLRPVEDVLMDMADPLANMESSSERVGILAQIMGRQGARMGPLFARGSEGVREMMAELEELGGGIGPDAVQASAELTDAQARLDLAFTSLKSKMAVVLLPALQRVVEWLQRFTQNTHAMRTVLSVGLVIAIGKATTALRSMGIAGLAANLKMLAGFLAIAAVAVALGLIVEDFITALEGGDSVLGRMADSMKEMRDDHKHTAGFAGWISRMWEDTVQWVEEVIASIASFFGGDETPEVNTTRRRGLVSPEEAARQTAAFEGSGISADRLDYLEARGIDPDSARARITLSGLSDTELQRFLERQDFAGSGALLTPQQNRERQQLINQANTYNIDAGGRSREEIVQLIQEAQDRSYREALEANSVLVGLDGGI